MTNYMLTHGNSPNILKNGYFSRRVNWNKSYFSDPNGGMILQRIIRESKFIPDRLKQGNEKAFDDDYFEYWIIENGEITKDQHGSFDDEWCYFACQNSLYKGVIKDIINKYNTQGQINMSSKVFFIPKTDTIYHQIVNEFSKHESAGDLPAIGSKGFEKKSKLNSLPYIEELAKYHEGSQEPIHVSWDFASDNAVIEAIIDFLKKSNRFDQLEHVERTELIPMHSLNYIKEQIMIEIDKYVSSMLDL